MTPLGRTWVEWDTFCRRIASLYVAGLGVLQWPETRRLLPSVHWEALLEL